MNHTSIEWVKNPDGTQGYTWNPITGCLNHDNGMCKGGNFPCYAYRLAHGRLKRIYLTNRIITPYAGRWHADDDPFFPRYWADRLNIKRKYEYGDCRNRIKRRGIFVCDMSDLFGIAIPVGEWQTKVIQMIRENPADRFFLLTKQPQNLLRFSPFPDNCWVGVTATDRRYFNMAIGSLAQIKATVRFISFEPLLNRVQHDCLPYLQAVFAEGNLDWVIIGAQTKPYKPPKIEWVQEIVEACNRTGIKVFLKENLRPLLENDHRAFMDPLYWRDGYYTSPEHPNIDLHLRQELPV